MKFRQLVSYNSLFVYFAPAFPLGNVADKFLVGWLAWNPS